MSRSLLVAAGLLVLLVAGCGGAADIGGACDTPGSMDECVGGAICTNMPGGNFCYAICEKQGDCLLGTLCNGVADTNIKSCQPV